MFKLKSNCYVALSFGGIEYPLQDSGFQNITIQSANRFFLPMVTMVLMDNVNYFTEQIPIQDGIPFQVQIGDDTDSAPKVMNFRVWNFKTGNEGGVQVYKITGYLDAPSYLFKSTNESIRGTSRGALSYICQQTGLTFDPANDTTSDMQTWIPGNKRFAVFAQEIAKHAYLNDRSHMQMCITSTGFMRFRNLANLNTREDLALFTHDDPNLSSPSPQYQVFSHSNTTLNGAKNIRGGYAHSIVNQSVLSASKVIKSLDVKLLTEALMQNKDVRQEVDRSRIDFTPIDCGNVHEKYQEARYQNERNANVYTFGVDVMVREQTDVDLLDLVNYNSYVTGNFSPEKSEAYTSAYVVTGKTIHLEVGNYFERISLYTTGVNKEVAA